ncbi:MAG: hypothetical protein NUV82_00905 [Candidatus Komeilibacteria bacterium]|nr:hypothetical protein [Candidatus Komeilibacteria bacterium]
MTSRSRLVNIDIIKFVAIILMVIDHWVIVMADSELSIGKFVFFSFIPLVQMGFLFSSGYLMGYSYKDEKKNKYIGRGILFLLLFLIMTWSAGETIAGSLSILLNFSLSTLIAVIFLSRRDYKGLAILTAVLFVATMLMQFFNYFGSTALDGILANYSYPVNSFSIYFFLGILLYRYQKNLQLWFSETSAHFVIAFLLIFYPLIFSIGIKINIHNSYLHLPLLIVSSAIIGFYFFYKLADVKMWPPLYYVALKLAQALLYIYVIHYIVLFGIIEKLDMAWWEVGVTLIVTIIFSIKLQELVKNFFRKSYI